MLKAVSRKKLRRGNYCIYQSAEFLALLEEADADMVAPLVLLGFCGARPNEMRRLKWENTRFNTRTLVLDALSTKTASRRTGPICEAALNVAKALRRLHGQIWDKKDDRWSKPLQQLHRRTGVKQQLNALRHSYISYRQTFPCSHEGFPEGVCLGFYAPQKLIGHKIWGSCGVEKSY